jgi:putative tricarboxylic transport membrane protein
MESLGFLANGFAIALLPLNLLMAFIGAFMGTLIGALPGIGPVNGVAILLPLVYALGLPAESSLILLTAVYYGSEYGGRISSILLNVPGDAGAIMTTVDGYPLARKGLAGPALALSGISSFVGGMIATCALVLFAPLLSGFALRFGPPEYFALILFAFASLAIMVGEKPAKTFIGVLLGLMISTIGIDPGTGVLRYTFGEPELFDGVDFLVVIIGLFAISEILLLLEQVHGGMQAPIKIERLWANMQEILFCKWSVLRASVVGFIIGVLPGAGASVASAVTYFIEKHLCDRDGTFGKGDLRGLAAPEAANNSAVGGAMVPMLTLGIPGSGTTAILLGALMLYDITPGPLLFTQKPELVWSLIASMFIGNIILLLLNLPLVGIFVRVLMLPNWVLLPGIAVMSFVGVFAVYGSPLSQFLMLALGFAAYFLRKLDYPVIPMILGMVLGRLMEENLRRALAMSGGDWHILVNSQITWVLWVLTALVLAVPAIRSFNRRRMAGGDDE